MSITHAVAASDLAWTVALERAGQLPRQSPCLDWRWADKNKTVVAQEGADLFQIHNHLTLTQ